MKWRKSVWITLIIIVLIQAPKILRYSEARQRAEEEQERELRYETAKETETRQDDCVLHLENVITIWKGLRTDDAAEVNFAKAMYDSVPEVCDGWEHNDPEAQRLFTELDAIVK